MDDKIKLYSEMEKYEIININDGDKYNCIGNNDIIIDENGELKYLILNDAKSRLSFFHGSEVIEVPWDYVKKIGSRTLIIDVENDILKKSHI